MKQKPFIRQKTYHCGPINKKSEYIEVDVFEHIETTRRARKKKELLSPPKQQNLNDKNARRYFSLLVKSNYTAGDYIILLTYEDDPDTIEAAEHRVELFLR